VNPGVPMGSRQPDSQTVGAVVVVVELVSTLRHRVS
jgi:hypothetical protein